MINALKTDEIFVKNGGRFKTCVLVQRRVEELLDGARPLIDRGQRSDLELAIEEVRLGKITLSFESADPSDSLPPANNGAVL